MNYAVSVKCKTESLRDFLVSLSIVNQGKHFHSFLFQHAKLFALNQNHRIFSAFCWKVYCYIIEK